MNNLETILRSSALDRYFGNVDGCLDISSAVNAGLDLQVEAFLTEQLP